MSGASELSGVVARNLSGFEVGNGNLLEPGELATADAVVYATALEYDADLLTCDAHFEGLPGVVLIRKAP